MVAFGLGGADGLVEVVVIEGRVDDLVAMIGEVGRLDAARNRMPAVEEEDSHRNSNVARCRAAERLRLSPLGDTGIRPGREVGWRLTWK
jgi:hypothetical protein